MAVVIYIAGHASTAGKSTVSRGLILSAFSHFGGRVEYVKPVTQCETPSAASLAFERARRRPPPDPSPSTSDPSEKAEREPVHGPVIFYSGLTRAVLDGRVRRDFLGEAAQRVERAAALAGDGGCVIVDGVGYPSVGSICGVAGADVARACGAAVVCIARCGVGDAVDSYSLLAGYTRARGAAVIGGVFNRCKTDGFYGVEECGKWVRMWMAGARSHDDDEAFGFIEGYDPDASSDAAPSLDEMDDDAFEAWFKERVDVAKIFSRAAQVCERVRAEGAPAPAGAPENTPVSASKEDGDSAGREQRTSATREEIEWEALQQGAPGCKFVPRKKPKKQEG